LLYVRFYEAAADCPKRNYAGGGVVDRCPELASGGEANRETKTARKTPGADS